MRSAASVGPVVPTRPVAIDGVGPVVPTRPVVIDGLGPVVPTGRASTLPRDAAWRLLAGVAMTLAMTAGCGDSASTPTQPTRLPAELSPTSLSASASDGPAGVTYIVTASAREIGGQTGAILRTVRLQFSRGATTVADAAIEDAWPNNRIAPGATASTRPITVADNRPDRVLAERVAVTVNYVSDSGGTSGSFTASVDVVPAPR
jgi:hypothetical protein